MKVYVIVPIYNTEKYLRKCLDSIFNQTYKDIFVICVNDGSKDKSLDILNEYKIVQNEKMAIINKSNGGLSSARNSGLNYISDWNDSLITFVDSDDYLTNDFIEHLVNDFETNHCDIVCSSFFVVNEEDNKEPIKREMPGGVYSPFECINFLLENKIQSHSPCKMYKALLWKETRFDETISFMEDQAITFSLFLKAKSILLDNWAGYIITLRLGSLCQSKMTNKKILDALRSYKIGCTYSYDILSKEEKAEIISKNLNLFGKIFLMMYPRFDKKHASENELLDWKLIRKFEKDNKIVKKFNPTSKKEFIKRFVFLHFRFAYKFLFKFFIKKYDR